MPDTRKMTDEERDRMLIEMHANVSLVVNQFKQLGGVVENHEGRIQTLEREILVGVHMTPEAAVPKQLSPPPPPSPMLPPAGPPQRLPPMRDRANTYDSIHALSNETSEIKRETKEQTTILTAVASDLKASGKSAWVAQSIGGAIAAALIVFAQQCQPGARLQPHPPTIVAPAPAPALSPPAGAPPSDRAPQAR